jgi:hypothetical protein
MREAGELVGLARLADRYRAARHGGHSGTLEPPGLGTEGHKRGAVFAGLVLRFAAKQATDRGRQGEVLNSELRHADSAGSQSVVGLWCMFSKVK